MKEALQGLIDAGLHIWEIIRDPLIYYGNQFIEMLRHYAENGYALEVLGLVVIVGASLIGALGRATKRLFIAGGVILLLFGLVGCSPSVDNDFGEIEVPVEKDKEDKEETDAPFNYTELTFKEGYSTKLPMGSTMDRMSQGVYRINTGGKYQSEVLLTVFIGNTFNRRAIGIQESLLPSIMRDHTYNYKREAYRFTKPAPLEYEEVEDSNVDVFYDSDLLDDYQQSEDNIYLNGKPRKKLLGYNVFLKEHNFYSDASASSFDINTNIVYSFIEDNSFAVVASSNKIDEQELKEFSQYISKSIEKRKPAENLTSVVYSDSVELANNSTVNIPKDSIVSGGHGAYKISFPEDHSYYGVNLEIMTRGSDSDKDELDPFKTDQIAKEILLSHIKPDDRLGRNALPHKIVTSPMGELGDFQNPIKYFQINNALDKDLKPINELYTFDFPMHVYSKFDTDGSRLVTITVYTDYNNLLPQAESLISNVFVGN